MFDDILEDLSKEYKLQKLQNGTEEGAVWTPADSVLAF